MSLRSRVKRAGVRAFHRLPAVRPKNRLRAALVSRVSGQFPKGVFVDSGDTVVVVGTPNPDRIHTFADLTGAGGRTIVFEPEPRNYERLRDAAAAYDNVTVDDRGVWSDAETKILKVADEANPGDHKIAVPGIEHDNDYRAGNYVDEMQISVDSLDALLSEYDASPDYVEIMVNGAELEVLAGASRTLEETSAKFWIKGHARDSSGKPINRRIRERLAEYGYNAVTSKGGTEAVGDIDDWEIREGDVFAWRSD